MLHLALSSFQTLVCTHTYMHISVSLYPIVENLSCWIIRTLDIVQVTVTLPGSFVGKDLDHAEVLERNSFRLEVELEVRQFKLGSMRYEPR